MLIRKGELFIKDILTGKHWAKFRYGVTIFTLSRTLHVIGLYSFCVLRIITIYIAKSFVEHRNLFF